MRLTWDDIGSRLYKAGIDRGVLFVNNDGAYGTGVSWSGLTGIDDSVSGHEATSLYSSGTKRGILFTDYEYGGTIRCFMYPDEFDDCIGHDEIAEGLFAEFQEGVPFGLCYRKRIGNDTDGINYGYEIHFIYGAVVKSMTMPTTTINASMDLSELSFAFETIPEETDGHGMISNLYISSVKMDADKLAAIEAIIYGTAETSPRLPLPDELVELVNEEEEP